MRGGGLATARGLRNSACVRSYILGTKSCHHVYSTEDWAMNRHVSESAIEHAIFLTVWYFILGARVCRSWRGGAR